MTKQVMMVFAVLIFTACTTLKTTNEKEHKKWSPEYRVQTGINHGGITENTDLLEVENVGVDAYSGATKIGANVGAHVLLPVKKNYVEVGVDYMINNQTFSYHDDINNYTGDRKITTSQFLFPITYNIGLFRKKFDEGLFQVKLGYVFQYNLFNVSDNGNNLPVYSTNNFASGFTMGIASTPFKLKNGTKLGFFLDGYRGSQVYEDFYNKSSYEMPATSYFKAGIIYHFKNKQNQLTFSDRDGAL